MKNIIGPKIDPCGTPHEISSSVDIMPLIETN